MTDLLTTDHADSGEVVRLHPSIVDTGVLTLGEGTQDLTYIRRPPLYRRPDATGEQPVVETDQPRPPQPLPALGPPPKTAAQVRRHRRPRPPWSPLARRALACWVCLAVVELAGLAALVVLR